MSALKTKDTELFDAEKFESELASLQAENPVPLFREALKTGGNSNFTLEKLPGLNHLFQTAETGSEYEYVQIEETISPKALTIIGDWILKQTSN